MKSRVLKLALLAVFVVIAGFWSAAYAGLQQVGPVDPNNGFPRWVMDQNGLSLALCVNDPVNCLADPVDPANPFSVQIGFGSEAFWWAADALVGGPPPAPDALLVLATEAAFNSLDGSAQDGFQSAFNRVRIRVSGAAANEICTVTHPFSAAGGEQFTADGVGVINVTADIGCFGLPGLPCDFNILTLPLSPIDIFLTCVAPPAPQGFIGNINVPCTVTGSPTGNNLFRVECPSFGILETNQFAVQGKRQGRFDDVPVTHLFFTQIEAIAAAGITAGCSVNPPLFCPDASITRGQMAVFIEASLGAAPPVCSGTVFSDVSPLTVGQAFCNFIEDFAAKGITGGCAADDPLTPANEARFCPNDLVTRAQMAVFIEAALGRPLPACAGNRFADVNTTVMSPAFCGFIEDFALQGISAGCQAGPPPLFCPNDPVTRGQMAVFLVAAPAPLNP